MFGTRSLWAAGLLAVLGALHGAAAIAADQTPEEILKSRGLTKSGTLYVLDAEAGFLAKFATVQPLYLRMREQQRGQEPFDIRRGTGRLCIP